MLNKKGFTMMELLVTVLLIGILAAMAMPQYMKVVEKQKGTEAVNILAVIGKAQERYFAVNEKYASDFSDLDSDLVDFNSKAAANGDTYNTKYFFFVLDGTDDKVSKVKASRRGNESYLLERNYTTGKVCCLNDNTEDGDICDVLDLPTNNCEGAATEPVSATCTGAQPLASQPCSSGCGMQTRSVSCSNGTWVTGSWTGTCTSPTQTLPTSQSCGTSGTQTRTCSASCSGGACGAWGSCIEQGCTGSKPSETQTCSSGCGTQTRSVACTNGSWIVGSWTGTCTSPTQTQATSQSCGNGGTQTRTCSASCNGGSCGAWSACVVPTCDSSSKPAESKTCSTGCGTATRTVTCSSGTWVSGAWDESACTSPTQTQTTSQACSSGCGTQTRTCTASCDGGSCGSWTGTCTSPTQKQATTRACTGASQYGTETRTCTATCDGGSCGSWVTSACKNCSWKFVSGVLCVDSSDGMTRTNTCYDYSCPSTCNTPGETVDCLLRVAHNATLKCVCI